MTFRSRKFLDVAREAPCMIQKEGVCQDGLYPCVPAHSNLQRHGRGFSHKSHDCFHVSACPACHDWLDRSGAPRDEKEAAFDAAQDRYWLWLWENGRLRVA